MKITRSTTVAQLKDFLGANFKAVKKQDKTLADSIMYASEQAKKDPKSVKKADLVDLAKQVISLLGDKVTDATAPKLVPAAENSVKPKPTLKGKDKSEKSDSDEKGETPKSTKKAPVPETVSSSAFPTEFTAGDTKYKLAHDIVGMKELLESFNREEEFVFAFYWNRAQIKQFEYGSGLLAAPKEFANNLDLASVLYVSDECKVAYALSMYTEVLYQIMPDSFEEIDGVRYSMGIEYQIYRAEK